MRVLADPPTLYVAGGSPAPYRLLYGSRSRALGAPDYDLARAPRSAVGLSRAVSGFLGEERTLEAPKTTTSESLLDRYPWLIEAALALVAIAFGAAGFVVLRRKA